MIGGKQFGRNKLSVLSPNKTIEGSLCALAASSVIAMTVAWFLEWNIFNYFLLGLLISVLAQIGDLYESLIKRTFEVKDSSSFIPGHGGFFDRTDSYLFVMPLLFYLYS